MRIIQVFNRYLHRGGEEASVERISDELSRRHRVFHCYFDSRQMLDRQDTLSDLFNVKEAIWNPISARRLKEITAIAAPDLILFHNIFPTGSAAVLSAGVNSRIPAVQVIHNFRPYSVNGYLWANGKVQPAGLRKNFFPEIFAGAWQQSRIKTAIYAIILWGMHQSGIFRRIHRWLAISDFVRDRFIEAGVDAKKIRTLRHSYDQKGGRVMSGRDEGYFLFLGRLQDVKGVHLLLELWDRFAQGSERVPDLLIAGEGPMEGIVRDAALKNPKIKYLGVIGGEEKHRVIEGARAMIAPSLWWEALGLVTYEAYDFFKPMLAARSGGLAETVIHGETGYLHCPGDVLELGEQVRKLSQYPELAEEMGMAGKKWLDRNTTSEVWLDAFERIVAGEG